MRRFFSLLVLAAIAVAISVLQTNGEQAPAKKGPKPMRVTDADNGKTVAIATGKAFDVVLKGNASTGFQWKVDKIDGDAVQQVGKVDYAPDKHPEGMVGVGGKYIVHFKVTGAAKTKVSLVYVRPWEKDTPPAQTFAVVIDSTAQEEGQYSPAKEAETPKSTQ
jgi:inhibitor of cysteine peptidase